MRVRPGRSALEGTLVGATQPALFVRCQPIFQSEQQRPLASGLPPHRVQELVPHLVPVQAGNQPVAGQRLLQQPQRAFDTGRTHPERPRGCWILKGPPNRGLDHMLHGGLVRGEPHHVVERSSAGVVQECQRHLEHVLDHLKRPVLPGGTLTSAHPDLFSKASNLRRSAAP